MVLSGQAVGANDPAQPGSTARVGMGLAGGLAVLLGILLWLLQEPWWRYPPPTRRCRRWPGAGALPVLLPGLRRPADGAAHALRATKE